MEISSEQHGALRILSPRGPLVGESAAELPPRVDDAIAQSAGRVALDLSRVTFVDSSGLEALDDAADMLSAIGQPARLIGANDTVLEALDITGLAPRFQMFTAALDAAGELP